MSIKEKIEKNPWTYLISVASGAVIITFGVLQFFHTERIKSLELNYQTKLDECNNAISSINRGLANEPDMYLNVKKIFVKSTDKLPDASKLIFYNTDEFYALSDSSYWKHKMINTYVAGQDFSNEDKKDTAKIMRALRKHRSRVHYWSGGRVFNVMESSLFVNANMPLVNTSLQVEKINIDTLAVLNAEARDPDHIEEFKIWAKKQMLSNSILMFIDNQRATAKFFPEMSYEIQDIQVQNDFVYVKAISTIKKQIIDYKTLENFYLKSETIGLYKNNYLYIITIVEPVIDKMSSDPEITKWLNCLKIIVD
jgi:hypothetical protein